MTSERITIEYCYSADMCVFWWGPTLEHFETTLFKNNGVRAVISVAVTGPESKFDKALHDQQGRQVIAFPEYPNNLEQRF